MHVTSSVIQTASHANCCDVVLHYADETDALLSKSPASTRVKYVARWTERDKHVCDCDML